MLVCILFALLGSVLVAKNAWENRWVKLCMYTSALLLILTLTVNCRTYKAKAFDFEYPLTECKVINVNNDMTQIKTPNGEYLVKKHKIVYYEAPDKDTEMLEVHGETRLYSYSAPNIIYYLFYLHDKEDSTENVIGVVNISKCK